MLDGSQGQFRLLPERLNQAGSALHGLQSASCEVTHFGNRVQAQIGNLVFLQIGPDPPQRTRVLPGCQAFIETSIG